MSSEEPQQSESSKSTELKKRIAQSAGVNTKTLERSSHALIAVIFGVNEKDLAADPYLREYCRYLLTGERPEHVKLSEDVEEEKKS